jgi:hypothetical protein
MYWRSIRPEYFFQGPEILPRVSMPSTNIRGLLGKNDLRICLGHQLWASRSALRNSSSSSVTAARISRSWTQPR